MRVSTKGCYGLRALVELARHHGEGPVLMRAIAERQGISRKYLHALLSSLRAAGLVRSHRGSAGGYVLARPPSQIHVLDILQALEGPLEVSACVRHDQLCPRAATCAGHDVWAGLSRALAGWLQDLSLADLVAREGRKSSQQPIYHI